MSAPGSQNRAPNRLEVATAVAGDWQPRIGALLDEMETTSPPTADLVLRTRQLSREVVRDAGQATRAGYDQGRALAEKLTEFWR